MAIPENDLDRIRLWCREQWPEKFWDQVWVDVEVTDGHVDIVEVRPHFGGESMEPLVDHIADSGDPTFWG